jgi:hypothetical protein
MPKGGRTLLFGGKGEGRQGEKEEVRKGGKEKAGKGKGRRQAKIKGLAKNALICMTRPVVQNLQYEKIRLQMVQRYFHRQETLFHGWHYGPADRR